MEDDSDTQLPPPLMLKPIFVPKYVAAWSEAFRARGGPEH